jgi:hypothetical protein
MFENIINRLFGEFICFRRTTVPASATQSAAVTDTRITARSYVIPFPLRGDEALGSWGPKSQSAGTVRVGVQTAPAADLPVLLMIINWRAKDDV